MPQPIDMQSELSRVAMAERMQDVATRASLAAQHRAQLEVEEDERVHETQVNEAEDAKRPDVDKDGRRKAPFVQCRVKKKKKTEVDEASHVIYTYREQKEIVDDPEAHDLDITI